MCKGVGAVSGIVIEVMGAILLKLEYYEEPDINVEMDACWPFYRAYLSLDVKVLCKGISKSMALIWPTVKFLENPRPQEITNLICWAAYL